MTIETTTTDATNTTDSATTSPPATDAPATVADAGGQAAPAAVTTDATTEATTTEPTAPQGAPEAYMFAAPEGQTFDGSIIDAYSAVAKDLNLPQDKAQKMLDTMVPAIAARQAEQLATATAQWADDARGDKELGGDKLPATLAIASKARDQFASPELRALLDQTGLGNHPEMLRMFYRAGKAISEDTFVGGRSSAGQSAGAQGFYSASKMNP